MVGFMEKLRGVFSSTRVIDPPSDDGVGNATLYCRRRALISVQEITALAPDATVTVVQPGKEKEWSTIQVAWPQVTVTLNRMDNIQMVGHLPGFLGYVQQQLDDYQIDFFTWRLIDQITATKHVIGTRTVPSFKAGGRKALSFIKRLAGRERALVFLGLGVVDPDFKPLLYQGAPYNPKAPLPEFPSGMERKARSEARLQKLNVPILQELPPITAEEEAAFPTPVEVARRALVLTAMALYATGTSQEDVREFLNHYQVADALSPKEQAFLKNPNPPAIDKSIHSWRIQSLPILLWALGLVEKPELPIGAADAQELVNFVQGYLSPDAFPDMCLRPLPEILDAADLIYRCHWLVRQAQLKHIKPPAGLSGFVTEEWHYALKWLTEHAGKGWDNVDTST